MGIFKQYFYGNKQRKNDREDLRAILGPCVVVSLSTLISSACGFVKWVENRIVTPTYICTVAHNLYDQRAAEQNVAKGPGLLRYATAYKSKRLWF